MHLRFLFVFVPLTLTLPCLAQTDVDILRQQVTTQQKQIE